jgi:SAM-dependent methyltransferase
MKRLTEQVHDILSEHVQPGDVVVDATLGTGRDAVFLSKLVGPTGRVFGLDLQPVAIQITKDRIASAELSNVVCIEGCHSNLSDQLPDDVQGILAAVVFNLGYLPGGDPDVKTKTDSSVAAIQTAYDLIRGGGVISVMAYIGHPGGEEEAAQVESTMAALPGGLWIRRDPPIDGSTSPRVLVLQKPTLD